jgi:EAL domain-containing protein (putative c-di-GMP-specific phosphodiesterase class I)
MRGKEKEMRVHQEFLDALNNHEFVPYYQPKVDVTNGRIVGGEALCRWFRDGRMIPPIEFIPALERTNDICKLDLYMLEAVCQNQRAWLDGGENRKLVPMSINFSRKHIMNLDFPDAVERIMDKYRIPHYAIEVELTETISDVEFSDIRRVVSSFHEKGINTSIDDFGMGFSSLNILKGIPWTTVKIDKSFLPEECDADDSEKSIMFRGVISMAKALGYRCIAEGVETEYQVNYMRANGCNIAQGYYYDKPLPKEEFEARLVTKHYDK